MNHYLLALIGLGVQLVVGFFVYGLFFKESLAATRVALTPTRTVTASIGMYIVAYLFVALFDNVLFPGAIGMLKGLYLGVLVGVTGFLLPLRLDSGWLGANAVALRAVVTNWMVTFIILGLVVGALS